MQASFGFNFGSLGAGPAKQSSLPPQRSSRRTPTAKTPRAADGSAQRHPSASVQRSNGVKRRSTPTDRTKTPQTGKRNRGSIEVQHGAIEEEVDELSPDREENVPSIEKSRKHARTVSPIREEFNEAPDELSILNEAPDEISGIEADASTLRKSVFGTSGVTARTPVSALANKRTSSGNASQRTPIAPSIGATPATSSRSIPRRSKSQDSVPITPGMMPHGRPRPSLAAHVEVMSGTPASIPADEESEDELSPSQINGVTQQALMQTQQQGSVPLQEVEMDSDELSSPMQPTPVRSSLIADRVPGRQPEIEENRDTALPLTNQKDQRLPVEDEDDDSQAMNVPTNLSKRGRPRKNTNPATTITLATPVARKPTRQKRTGAVVEEHAPGELDELSPESVRTSKSPARTIQDEREVVEASNGEESDGYEEAEPEEEVNSTPQHTVKRASPKQTQLAISSSEMPIRKRRKFDGPKHAISVMRIRGSTVRGITVADTTRTVLEETIDNRLSRMAERAQTSQDSARRKELRSSINLTLSFKESLDEKLLDLQDANDVLSTNFKKVKLFKRDNAQLRKEILTLQNDRQEIALEQDDVQAAFDAEKARVEARNTLSANIFDIEAAIQNGRERARKERREDEGPKIPLSMLLDTVGRDVGSFGGGLFSHVKGFNGLLEWAAGWLEGRV